MSAVRNIYASLLLVATAATVACGDNEIVVILEEMNDSGFSGHAELRDDARGKTLFPKVTSWVNLEGGALEPELLGGTVYRGTCDSLGDRSPNSNYVGINKMTPDAGVLKPAFDSLILGEMASIGGERFSFVVDVVHQSPRTVQHVACGNIP